MNETLKTERCALVLVDYQIRLLPAIHDGKAVVARAARLADVARLLGVRVVGTEQNPAGLGPNAPAIVERCDWAMSKRQFDACADGLVDVLDAAATPPTDVVVAGCESHVCLLQTALGLLRAGKRTWVVENASSSRRASDHAVAMERLRAAGAIVVVDEMVLFEWLHSCDHPKFRAVLERIRTQI